MERITYSTRGVCSRQIDIEIENGVVRSVRFHGGCAGNTQGVAALVAGNTQGVAALVAGMTVEEAVKRLGGIRCGFKPTSCPDQLACALKQYQESKK